MEANPGSFEVERFRGFHDAGIHRLSIGIQSFDNTRLAALGRVHDRSQAIAAAEAALQIFPCVNLDVMFGLPGQDLDGALADIAMALSMQPKHLSCYQLTIEPNTAFAAAPPKDLPDDELLADMQLAIIDRLAEAGLARYEISAYAAQGHACQHNLNYWNFGDYLGIGAGAHGKISTSNRIVRTVKRRHPEQYMQLYAPGAGPEAAQEGMRLEEVAVESLPFEFMLNALRLTDGVPASLWRERTGTAIGEHPFLLSAISRAQALGLLAMDASRFRATPRGLEMLSDLQEIFLRPDAPG
jgi:oxygen-independent coproporphyrinogen-3 oxidase